MDPAHDPYSVAEGRAEDEANLQESLRQEWLQAIAAMERATSDQVVMDQMRFDHEAKETHLVLKLSLPTVEPIDFSRVLDCASRAVHLCARGNDTVSVEGKAVQQ